MTNPEAVPRFPLEWPLGWRRARNRSQGRFQTIETTYNQGVKHDRRRALSMADAVKRLETELEKVGAISPVLSTNVSLTMTGRPRGDENPSDPGVALYFLFKKRPTVLACDTYYRVADNIAAIAAHLEHLRGIERHGVGTMEQALAGYKALPADTAANWRAVFGFPKDSRPSIDLVDSAYKALARQKHPDAGGSDADMAHVNRARDYALAELDGNR